MGKIQLLMMLVAVILILFGCGQETGADIDSILVFCGAANKPAMEEIARLFKKETGIRVEMLLGGSGGLLYQIEMSERGDIYIPGSPDYIIIGERKGLLVENSDRFVAYLIPAIITPADNPAGIRSLDDLRRPGVKVGMGNPETVCLGLYGIELLVKNDLLSEVMKNVVTMAGSCSRTANLAALGSVDAIIGWRVFHFWNPKRMRYIPISSDKIPRISYIPIAIPVYTHDIALSKRFIDFVLSPVGRSIYHKNGYITSREKALEFAPDASIGGEYILPEEYHALLKIGKQ
jgi:molybdate transport system substrate-binding protein